jgi:threonyl-tRNA synthetase
MLHRVLVGSMERFVGGLIEHYAGAFPLWLAPEQVRVVPVIDDVADAASAVCERLTAAGVRAQVDRRSGTLNYRIREAALMKVPYLAVIGKREAADGTVAVTVRGAGEKQHPVPVPAETFVRAVRHEIETRSLRLEAGGAPAPAAPHAAAQPAS